MLPELRELYQEVILDHGRNPRNFRHPEHPSHEAQGFNPMCGDRITVYLTVGDAGLIEDVAFEGRGCAISQASASMMTEMLVGRTVEQADVLFRSFHAMCTGNDDAAAVADGDEEAVERLQVLSGVREFPTRVKCATLAWHAMQAALHGKQKVTTE
jgi:nitrogen fixation protein NifU and related proteins